MLYYYALYFYVILLIMFYESVNYKILKKIFFLLILGGLIILPAIRDSSVGTDTKMYVNFTTWDYSFTDWLKTIEVGNALIFSFYNYFTPMENKYVFLTYSILTNFFIFYAVFKYSKNVFVSVVVLFGFNCFYFYQMNVMRQCLAVGITFLANSLLLSNKKKLSLLFYFLAIMFHYSAVVCLFLIFIKKYVNRFFLLILIFLSLAFVIISLATKYLFSFVSGLGFLVEKYSAYATAYNDNGAGIKIFMLNLSIFLIFILFSNVKKCLEDDSFKIYFIFMILGLVIQFCIAFLNLSAMSFGRIFQYFIYGYIFGIPMMINSISKEFRPIIYIFLFIIFALYMYAFIVIAQVHELIPYQVSKDWS